ncbi:hypothetical protein TNCT_313701 [Trichonephila clavata]|uniref:Uncharacterized protein n=1 Tax=Trichonephila clavata TaxID=2740835 RepID=A0A8X6GCQ4_TRICU|nr:hypothetical protein TNCT_313701 [Trichonephila clavata]
MHASSVSGSTGNRNNKSYHKQNNNPPSTPVFQTSRTFLLRAFMEQPHAQIQQIRRGKKGNSISEQSFSLGDRQ